MYLTYKSKEPTVPCASQARQLKSLLFQTELLGKRAVCTLVCGLEVFQMLATVSNEAEKSSARAFVLPVLIQMS